MLRRENGQICRWRKRSPLHGIPLRLRDLRQQALPTSHRPQAAMHAQQRAWTDWECLLLTGGAAGEDRTRRILGLSQARFPVTSPPHRWYPAPDSNRETFRFELNRYAFPSAGQIGGNGSNRTATTSRSERSTAFPASIAVYIPLAVREEVESPQPFGCTG